MGVVNMISEKIKLKSWAVTLMLIFLVCVLNIVYRMYLYAISDIEFHFKFLTLTFCTGLLIGGATMCFMFCKILWKLNPQN